MPPNPCVAAHGGARRGRGLSAVEGAAAAGAGGDGDAMAVAQGLAAVCGDPPVPVTIAWIGRALEEVGSQAAARLAEAVGVVLPERGAAAPLGPQSPAPTAMSAVQSPAMVAASPARGSPRARRGGGSGGGGGCSGSCGVSPGGAKGGM